MKRSFETTHTRRFCATSTKALLVQVLI